MESREVSKLSPHPFDDILNLTQIACIDDDRASRTGIPEVVLADRKTIAQTLAITLGMLERHGKAILSRVSPDLLVSLQREFPGQLEVATGGRTVVVRRAGQQPTPEATSPCHTSVEHMGRVGILTAGTSDIPVAEEAAVICREAGCHVLSFYDVGVAGLHRLYEPLRSLITEAAVDVIIVAAGMDGALPSVVAGLVAVPVIGLPTSVGYGLGGNGLAALLSMLQGCAPGLAVVNIDNGVGAGAIAVRIAHRAAVARKRSP